MLATITSSYHAGDDIEIFASERLDGLMPPFTASHWLPLYCHFIASLHARPASMA